MTSSVLPTPREHAWNNASELTWSPHRTGSIYPTKWSASEYALSTRNRRRAPMELHTTGLVGNQGYFACLIITSRAMRSVSFCGSMRFRIREHLVQEAVQSLAESSGDFEDTLVPGDHEHLSRAVVNCRAAAATPQMPLDLLAHLDTGVSIHVFGEVGDYRFAANHGFDPFQRSQMETLGFAKIGVSASRSMRRARCSRVLTADSPIP